MPAPRSRIHFLPCYLLLLTQLLSSQEILFFTISLHTSTPLAIFFPEKGPGFFFFFSFYFVTFTQCQDGGSSVVDAPRPPRHPLGAYIFRSDVSSFSGQFFWPFVVLYGRPSFAAWRVVQGGLLRYVLGDDSYLDHLWVVLERCRLPHPDS